MKRKIITKQKISGLFVYFKNLKPIKIYKFYQSIYLNQATCLSLFLPPYYLTKFISRLLNCLTMFIVTTESSIRPMGPKMASGIKSIGESVYRIITIMILTLGLVNKYLIPSGVNSLGASLIRVPISKIDLKNYIVNNLHLAIVNT